MTVSINQIHYKTLPRLMQELVDHFKISKTLLGFLMSLNEEEIHKLMDSLENPKDLLITFPIITLFKGIPEEGTKLTKQELDDEVLNCLADLSTISMYKRGLLDLTPSENENDDEWLISATEKGKEFFYKNKQNKKDEGI